MRSTPSTVKFAMSEDRAGIVDENVEPRIDFVERRRQTPHLGLRRQVRDQKIDLRVARLLGDPRRRLASARLVAPDDHDMRALSRHAQGGFLADAECRARHQTEFSTHFIGHSGVLSSAYARSRGDPANHWRATFRQEIGASGPNDQRRGLIPAFAAFPPAHFPIRTGCRQSLRSTPTCTATARIIVETCARATSAGRSGCRAGVIASATMAACCSSTCATITG